MAKLPGSNKCREVEFDEEQYLDEDCFDFQKFCQDTELSFFNVADLKAIIDLIEGN